MQKKDKNIIEKLSDFAFAMGVIGVAFIGICPAFGIMGIVVPVIMKVKNAPMGEEVIDKNKKSLILGIASIIMFIIDLGLISFAHIKLGWFS